MASPSLKIIHNASFDIPRLEAAGFIVGGPLWDTLAAAQVIDPDAPGFSLNEVASFHLTMARWKHVPGRRPKDVKVREWKKPFPCATCGAITNTGSGVGKGRVCRVCTFAEIEQDRQRWETAQRYYNLEDAAVLPPIYVEQRRTLEAREQLTRFEHMMRVTRQVLIPIQQRGLRIDPAARVEAARTLTDKLAKAKIQWQSLAGDVNPSSPLQLRRLFYTEWGLPRQSNKDGGDSTDAEAINNLLATDIAATHRDALGALSEIRRSTKWLATYTGIGDRIYPAYGPVGKDTGGRIIAATGRILAKGAINPDGTKTPPLQQIPDELRHLVIPEPGLVFVGADYSSQELRLVAAKSGCQRLLNEVAAGVDIHAANCVVFKCDRTRAKNVFYSWVFGGSPRSAQRALRLQGFMVSEADLRVYFDILTANYPEIPRYHTYLLNLATRDGYLKNSFGRRRYFRDATHLRNEILNFPIQADGADIGLDIIEPTDTLARFYGGFLSILLHDGFYWQVPPRSLAAFVPLLRDLLQREWPMVAPGFSIPVEIKTGPNWRDLEAAA